MLHCTPWEPLFMRRVERHLDAPRARATSIQDCAPPARCTIPIGDGNPSQGDSIHSGKTAKSI